MATTYFKPCAPAASRAFDTTELLGIILGYLDAKSFCYLQLTYPRTLPVAKLHSALRRKFFLEPDPTITRRHLHLNPICDFVLSTVGWHIEAINLQPVIQKTPPGARRVECCRKLQYVVTVSKGRSPVAFLSPSQCLSFGDRQPRTLQRCSRRPSRDYVLASYPGPRVSGGAPERQPAFSEAQLHMIHDMISHMIIVHPPTWTDVKWKFMTKEDRHRRRYALGTLRPDLAPISEKYEYWYWNLFRSGRVGVEDVPDFQSLLKSIAVIDEVKKEG